jgi:hypothetical protein
LLTGFIAMVAAAFGGYIGTHFARKLPQHLPSAPISSTATCIRHTEGRESEV